MKVLICDKVESAAIEKMRKAGLTVDDKAGIKPEELLQVVGDYEVLVVRSATKVTKEVFDKGKNLKLVVRGGVGMDNIDAVAAKAANVIADNTPEASTNSVAELTLGLMFCLARKICVADSTMKAGKWEKKRLEGTELGGKTLGLVGSGRIGFETARKCIALGMNVIAYDPYLNPVPEHITKAGIKMVKTLDEIYAQSDYISVHTPKTKETAGMINAAAFTKMKKNAYVINCARGGIINEKDLVDALKAGTIAGAAIDVYEKEPILPDNPLLTAKEVAEKLILLPHLGASSVEGQNRVGGAVADKIIAFAKK
jgi:D-3-phosphoglycerate dehydrogenase / 2-oxoglutarate reductase